MGFGYIAVGILLVSALFFLTSCGSDSCPDVSGEEHSRASIEGLIEHYAGSLEARDIDAYSGCLTEGYIFEFTPEDADSVGLPPDEPWWGKIPDVASTSNMFSDPEVTQIQVDLYIESRGYAGGIYTVTCDPSIRVTVEPAGGGEAIAYWVFSSWLYFEIGLDETESGLLQIVGIREEIKEGPGPGSLAATEGCTFGGIKAMYK